MLQPILKNNLSEVTRILKNHKVKRAYAFGSVCTEHFDDNSDIDLLIAFEIDEPFKGYAQNFWDMEAQLSNLLNRKVELIPEHTVSNPFFIKVMNRTKTVLYD
jgi:hypothetical protein